MKSALAFTIFIAAVLYWLFSAPSVADLPIPDSAASVERGRYLVAAGGCVSCHEGTEYPQSLSGGLALESEFGTFYVSNITPDVKTGIGGWSGRELLAALKHGRSPTGSFYYPAFPYPSYAGMTDEDALDIAAYLMSLSPVDYNPPEHHVPVWLPRWVMAGWTRLAALISPPPAGEIDPIIARGAYLARYLGHCGECHTPRNALGINDLSREFAGGMLGEDVIEAIDGQALADWSEDDFLLLLSLGLKPDGDFVGGEMEKVIEHNTSRLTREDQQALAAFFKRDRI